MVAKGPNKIIRFILENMLPQAVCDGGEYRPPKKRNNKIIIIATTRTIRINCENISGFPTSAGSILLSYLKHNIIFSSLIVPASGRVQKVTIK